ncbi:class I adenylate-forming enzyme family protein [Actinomadura rugatobispora]|uniref:Class I adenylate-forming enzyme family protein n=1 Tax=Actinomadura rugatobispora TaxID=1994 RepID=A0ABW0ZUZ5_9ACTN|nr:cyclohexanecarboxylate-CoA ligase [Actinomadura rugatobispora]
MTEFSGGPGSVSLWGLVEAAARARPDDIVLADDHGRSLTTAAFRDAAERAAAGLLDLGVRPGDALSWQLPTILEAPVLMAACARLGVTQNPLIPVLREREVGFIVDQVGPRLLVVPETWRGFAHGEMARALGPQALVLDLEGTPGPGIRLPAGDPGALPPATAAGEPRCRWIYYTSGTTADAKGARHTDASVLQAARNVIERHHKGPADVSPAAWPFAHIGGVSTLGSVLIAGGRMVMFESFDPATTPERMAAHRPTILGSATPFFHAYIAAQRRHGGPGPLFPDVRVCISGGAAVPEPVNREVAEVLGVPGVIGAWGLTEFPVASSETPDDPRLGSTVGRPTEGVRVRIVDGELRLKGPQCFLGYVDASLDAEAFDEDGWFRTGDLGEVHGDGRISITGRLKDVIIRNAENISALDVENALLTHPDVADAAVVGVPDARTGERVCAVVVARPGGPEVTLAGLSRHCLAEGLARFKTPERLVVVDRLPRNPMGKILKNELRAAALESAAKPEKP